MRNETAKARVSAENMNVTCGDPVRALMAPMKRSAMMQK
jgi:hypothetical protein